MLGRDDRAAVGCPLSGRFLQGYFMKKLMAFLVIFILAAAAVCAQMPKGMFMSAWGRAAFVPFWYNSAEYDFGKQKANSEDEFKSGTGVTWDPNSRPRVDFRIHGFNDYLGFTVHINAEAGGSVGNGDNGAQMWAKPFGNDILKLTAANIFIDDTLRGRVTADTGFENYVLGKSMTPFNGREPLNQDVIFNRFGGGRGNGVPNASNTSTHITSPLSNVFFVSSVPVKGMFLAMMLQGDFPIDLKETWRQVHAAAGYDIQGVGLARAQYIGGYMGKEKSMDDLFKPSEPSKIEAAFAYTGVRNLVIDLGLKFWMPITKFDSTEYYRGADIGFGASYRNGQFNIAGMAEILYLGAYTGAQAHTPASDKGADGVQLTFNLIPAMDFDFGSIGLSMIFQAKMADTAADGKKIETGAGSQWMRFGVGAWYRKGLLGGYIKTGVTYSPASIRTGYRLLPDGSGLAPESTTGLHGRSIIAVPVIFEYSFF